MSATKPPYTLAQLAADAAELLKTMPPDTLVVAEGCDCTEYGAGLEVGQDRIAPPGAAPPVVMLTRIDH
jgi:hypothetical protein